jgi:GalNAc-alpha-(1->4)-GalNAc-alpha-(1->3)-diNAcBac-PP-undecaprenol alpha-1,4-N-acetyl-D-galactosaminyltransferase
VTIPLQVASRRIVFVIGSLKPGGAERVLTLLANELVERGHSVAIVTIKDNPDVFSVDPRVDRIRLNIAGVSKGPLDAIRLFFLRSRTLRQGIRSLEPDYVISFLDVVNVRVLLAMRGSGVPVFVSERNTISAMKGRLWPILRRLVYPWASGLIVQTERQREEFLRYNRAISVVPNPLVLPHPPSFQEKEPIILLAGRMNYQKQFDRFVSEMRSVNFNGFRIVIVGEHRHPMIDEINTLLETGEYPTTVETPGHRSDIGSYYARSAIFVLPSLHEGFPNALSEALSYGCACISFDCPTGPAELIENGINGFLVPDQDWDALRVSLQLLINKQELRRTFYSTAIERQKRYELPIVVDQWLSICEAVLRTDR